MAFTAKVEEARKKALADKNNSSRKGFSGDIRMFDLTSLEKGDVVKIEFEDDDVIEQKLGTRVVDGKEVDNLAQYIILETEGGKVINFYPSVFTKARRVYEKDGKETNVWARTGGTAVTEYKKHGTVEAGMNALKGKTIKVVDSTPVYTKAFNEDRFVSTNILTLDLVD